MSGKPVRCPACGSDELGINVLVVECRDIHDPRIVHSREDVGASEEAVGGWKYTCVCGHEFNDFATLPLRGLR